METVTRTQSTRHNPNGTTSIDIADQFDLNGVSYERALSEIDYNLTAERLAKFEQQHFFAVPKGSKPGVRCGKCQHDLFRIIEGRKSYDVIGICAACGHEAMVCTE